MKKLDRNFIKSLSADNNKASTEYLLSMGVLNIADEKKMKYIKDYREKKRSIEYMEYKTLKLIG